MFEKVSLRYTMTLALLQYDVGGASASGAVATILANVVAFFLVRSVARRLEV